MDNERKQAILYLGIIFIIILIMRLPTAPFPIFNIDESIFATVANAIIDGKLIYRDVAFNSAPVTPYFYAFIFGLFGKNNMFALHVALIILIFAINYIIYRMSILIGSKRIGYVALAFFAVFSYTYEGQDMLAFGNEWLAALFCCLGAYFLLSYFKENRRLPVFLCGLSFGMAFFTKQFSLSIYFVALLFSCIMTHNKKTIFNLGKVIIVNLAGFFLICISFFSFFSINRIAKDFWFWFWTYNSRYYVFSESLLQRIKLSLQYLTRAGSFFDVNYLLLILFLVYLIIIVFTSTRHLRLRNNKNKTLSIEWFLILWAVFAYIAASYSLRNFGHYYIITLPPLCIIAGALIELLLEPLNLDNLTNEAKHQFSLKLIQFKVFLLLFVIFGLLSPLYKFSNRLKLWELYFVRHKGVYSPPVELNEAAEYIKSNTEVNEKIFVWGFYPELYVLTGRPPASRYVECNFLTGLVPWINISAEVDTSRWIVPGAWETFMEDMEKNKPKLVIDTSIGNINHYGKYPPEKFENFYSFLKKHYRTEKVLYNRNGRAFLRVFKRLE